MQIVVGEVSSGAIIAFPKDGVVLQSLKKTFPKARWDQGRRAWHVPGVRAYKRSLAWVEDISDVVANREAAALEALAVARETAPKSKYVWYHERGATVATPYSDRIVEICRSLDGAFDRSKTAWEIPATRSADLVAFIGEIDRIATTIDLRETERKAAEQARYLSELTARKEKHAERCSSRYVELCDRVPSIGAVLRFGGRTIVVESHGKRWRADENLSSVGGPVGVEGQWVCYIYFRPATSDEITALEVREAADNEKAQAYRAQKAAIDEVGRSMNMPPIGREPDGEILWEDPRHESVGYATKIVLAPDGYLWSVTHNSGDGAFWGEYNCGYNTVGRRMEAREDLVARITWKPEGS